MSCCDADQLRMAPILLLLASLWIAVGSASVVSSKNASSDDSHRGQPNFIFIMTDDQDLLLNSLDYQPLVKRHFIDKGTMFQKHFCTVSICCPSRVSLLTGRAAHNTNVTDVAAVSARCLLSRCSIHCIRVSAGADSHDLAVRFVAIQRVAGWLHS